MKTTQGDGIEYIKFVSFLEQLVNIKIDKQKSSVKDTYIQMYSCLAKA